MRFGQCKFSAIFRSVRQFPIYPLVKIQQTFRLCICRLVKCVIYSERGFKKNLGKHGYRMTDLLTSVILKGERMHAYVTKFTATKIPNTQEQLWVNTVEWSKMKLSMEITYLHVQTYLTATRQPPLHSKYVPIFNVSPRRGYLFCVDFEYFFPILPWKVYAQLIITHLFEYAYMHNV